MAGCLSFSISKRGKVDEGDASKFVDDNGDSVMSACSEVKVSSLVFTFKPKASVRLTKEEVSKKASSLRVDSTSLVSWQTSVLKRSCSINSFILGLSSGGGETTRIDDICSSSSHETISPSGGGGGGENGGTGEEVEKC